MTPGSDWLDWLAKTGYGTDYSFEVAPPCSLRELAEAYHRAHPEEDTTVEQWEWCITENTGALDGAEPLCCLWTGCHRVPLPGSVRCVFHTPSPLGGLDTDGGCGCGQRRIRGQSS